MRRAARVDANQGEIVAALRKAGASVTPTHAAGDGFPDLAVGFRGQTFLLEVKDGSKPPSARKLTSDQVKWHDEWRGHAVVVCTIEAALAAIGLGVRRDPKSFSTTTAFESAAAVTLPLKGVVQ